MADLASSISDAKTPLSLPSSLWRPPSQTPCHLRSDCAVSEIFELDFGFYKTKDPLRLLVISDPTALSMRFLNWILGFVKRSILRFFGLDPVFFGLASGIFEIRVGFREKEGKRESLVKKGLLQLDTQGLFCKWVSFGRHGNSMKEDWFCDLRFGFWEFDEATKV
ncbi:hypothetical protein COP1_006656 [Malus domestica]